MQLWNKGINGLEIPFESLSQNMSQILRIVGQQRQCFFWRKSKVFNECKQEKFEQRISSGNFFFGVYIFDGDLSCIDTALLSLEVRWWIYFNLLITANMVSWFPLIIFPLSSWPNLIPSGFSASLYGIKCTRWHSSWWLWRWQWVLPAVILCSLGRWLAKETPTCDRSINPGYWIDLQFPLLRAITPIMPLLHFSTLLLYPLPYTRKEIM